MHSWQFGDVELHYSHHRLHDTTGHRGIRVLHELAKNRQNDIARDAELVPVPAALLHFVIDRAESPFDHPAPRQQHEDAFGFGHA